MSRPALAILALAAVATTAVALGGCTPPAAAPIPTAAAGERMTVVTTIGVLADFARQLGGDRVEVQALVPRGADVHTFDPAPSDVTRLADARLVFTNGLGLDDWLEAIASDAGVPATNVVALGEGLDGVTYLERGDEHLDRGADAGGHAWNPHLWLDASLAARYVDRLATALSEADPSAANLYAANAAAYTSRLEALDREIRERLEAIPEASRRVVSFHDAFPYFAAAYDLEIVGVVVAAPGQEPSAAEIATLISAIRDAGVRVILAEAQFSDALADTIAAEAGATVIRDLYTDSLGEPPVDTYEGAMRWNVGQIADGLR